MPGWLTHHFFVFDFRALWRSGLSARVERQSARKSKTKNGRSTSLASIPLVTVPILELWAKTGYVKFQVSLVTLQHSIHVVTPLYTLFTYTFIAKADDSRGGWVFTAICVFVCFSI